MGRRTKHLLKEVPAGLEIDKRWSKREIAETLYRQHIYTLSAIGRFTGLTRERVRQIANEIDQGISMPALARARRIRQRRDEIVELYCQKGLTGPKIAEKLNMNVGNVYANLHRGGVRSYTTKNNPELR